MIAAFPIWTIPETIARLPEQFEQAAGDGILPGAPSDVASVARGDTMAASIEGIGTIVAKAV